MPIIDSLQKISSTQKYNFGKLKIILKLKFVVFFCLTLVSCTQESKNQPQPLTSTATSGSSHPYVVFVNGYRNCCASEMHDLQTRLINQMNAEPRYVPYSNFDDGGTSELTSTDERFLRDGADFINNQLDKNRPLILIGHSFGGDSVLKLLPRINRRIQLVAVIDPVRTGGFRNTLKTLQIPSNVDYFYNRWQKNVPFPIDFTTNGSIDCKVRICDQDSQFALTDTNGNPHRVKCKLVETCKTKQERADHSSLATDDWIQRVIGDKIQEQLAAFSPPSTVLTTGKSIISSVGTCIDAAAETINSERGTLQLYPCNGSPNQQWSFSEGKLIMNTPAGTKCLDAAAETINSERGTLQLYPCNGSPNQQWKFG